MPSGTVPLLEVGKGTQSGTALPPVFLHPGAANARSTGEVFREMDQHMPLRRWPKGPSDARTVQRKKGVRGGLVRGNRAP